MTRAGTQHESNPPPVDMGWAYLRVSQLERPTLTVAVVASMREGRFGTVRMAVGCVGSAPMRLHELEERLAGAPAEDARKLVLGSSNYLTEILKPEDDLHGSSVYKVHITGTLLGRGLAQIEAGKGEGT